METQKTTRHPSIKTVAWTFVITFTLVDCAGTMSYVSYAYTDLARIPVALTGVSNFIVTILGAVASLTVGAIIAKTHTRFGQCRPFMMFSFIFVCLGMILMYAAAFLMALRQEPS